MTPLRSSPVRDLASHAKSAIDADQRSGSLRCPSKSVWPIFVRLRCLHRSDEARRPSGILGRLHFEAGLAAAVANVADAPVIGPNEPARQAIDAHEALSVVAPHPGDQTTSFPNPIQPRARGVVDR